jgi:hypothetical protein
MAWHGFRASRVFVHVKRCSRSLVGHVPRPCKINATPLMVAPKLFIDLVTKARIQALERERHQIVNNFAVSASAGYELAPLSP